jgi:hypothetical protein
MAKNPDFGSYNYSPKNSVSFNIYVYINNTYLRLTFMHSPYKGRKKIIIIIVRFHGLIQKSTIKPRYCFLENQRDYYFF